MKVKSMFYTQNEAERLYIMNMDPKLLIYFPNPKYSLEKKNFLMENPTRKERVYFLMELLIYLIDKSRIVTSH